MTFRRRLNAEPPITFFENLKDFKESWSFWELAVEEDDSKYATYSIWDDSSDTNPL